MISGIGFPISISFVLNSLKGSFFSAGQSGGRQTLIKVKVFYGQEPPSGESTTTESGVNYQLLSVMH